MVNSHDMVDPTPEEFGFPVSPTRANVECWTRQEAFLEAYRHTSRTADAAKAAGVSMKPSQNSLFKADTSVRP
jgi:hypothetical protein